MGEGNKGGLRTPGRGDCDRGHPQPWAPEKAAPGYRKAGTAMPRGDPSLATTPALRGLGPPHSRVPQALGPKMPSHTHLAPHSGV